MEGNSLSPSAELQMRMIWAESGHVKWVWTTGVWQELFCFSSHSFKVKIHPFCLPVKLKWLSYSQRAGKWDCSHLQAGQGFQTKYLEKNYKIKIGFYPTTPTELCYSNNFATYRTSLVLMRFCCLLSMTEISNFLLEIPSLESFQSQLDVLLCKTLWVQRGWSKWSPPNSNSSVIPWLELDFTNIPRSQLPAWKGLGMKSFRSLPTQTSLW